MWNTPLIDFLFITLAILGIAALFAWAGLFVGPTLAIITSIIPIRPNKESIVR
jgi:hypothetical protein